MARMPRGCRGNAISDQWYTVISTTLAALCVGALGWIKVDLRARRNRVLRCISTVQCLAGDDAVDFCRRSAVFRKADGRGLTSQNILESELDIACIEGRSLNKRQIVFT
jgi:hypothetical protein